MIVDPKLRKRWRPGFDLGEFCIFAAFMLPLAVVLLSIYGCGLTPHPDTNVSAAVSRVTDDYTDKASAEPTDTEVTVQPTTQASSGAAATQPVVVTVDGTTIHAPPGAAIRYKKHVDGGPAETSEHRESSATGSSLVTNGPKGDFVSQPNKTELAPSSVAGPNGRSKPGGGNSEAGGTSYAWDAIIETISSPAGITMLSIIGGLLIAGGVLMVIVEHAIGGSADWPLFGMMEVGGIGLIALSIVVPQHPVMILLFIVAGVAGVVWYVFYWKKKAPASTTSTPATPSAHPLASAEGFAASVISQLKSEIATLTSKTTASDDSAKVQKVQDILTKGN